MVANSSPGTLPYPGIEPMSPTLAGHWFTTEPQGEPLFDLFFSIKDFPVPTHLQDLLILPVWLFTLCPVCTFRHMSVFMVKSNLHPHPNNTFKKIKLAYSSLYLHMPQWRGRKTVCILFSGISFLGDGYRTKALFFLFALGLCFLQYQWCLYQQ